MLIYCVALVFLFVGNACAAGSQVEIDSLRGIKSIEVVVEHLTNNESGPSEGQIKSDVELKLRLAGIKLISPGKDGFLYVRIGCRHINNYVYSVNIIVQYKQPVYLMRNQSSSIGATWESGSFGYIGSQKIDSLRDAIKDIIDLFLNDYLTANPKK
jgi:hypothetical protein